jgi:hypothetical protein
MENEVFTSVRDLLLKAKEAHGVYEANELGGEYDKAWADWYAAWLIKNDINKILKQSYGVESLSASLSAMASSQKDSTYPPEKWADYYAATLLHEAK